MDIIQIYPYPARPRKRRVIPRTRLFCDISGKKTDVSALMRHEDVQNARLSVVQTFLGRESRTKHFVTEESYTYISPQASYARGFGREHVDSRKRFDGVHVRAVQNYSFHENLYMALDAHFSGWRAQVRALRDLRSADLSPVRMWQMSMACAMVFGMITISMVYKNFGSSVQAKGVPTVLPTNDSVSVAYEVQQGRLSILDKVYSEDELVEQKRVHAETVAKELELAAQEQKLAEQQQKKKQEELMVARQKAQAEADAKLLAQQDAENFERKAREMVAGYPIEQMLPEILKQDREVAIYMIAMAKQESQWGKRVPVLRGEDCFNYWGFRAKRARMGSGGHTCFDSHADAVQTVGKRVHNLIYDYKRTTPERMLVWKCGSSCAGHSPDGVKNWVNTVTMYRDALKS